MKAFGGGGGGGLCIVNIKTRLYDAKQVIYSSHIAVLQGEKTWEMIFLVDCFLHDTEIMILASVSAYSKKVEFNN